MRALLAFVLVSALLAAPAAAQITNGDFNAGLTGWLPVTSGVAAIAANPFGNPANSAQIFETASGFTLPNGVGTLSQQFGCGSSFEPGPCVVYLEYMAFANFGASVQVEVWVDSNLYYTMNHPGPSNAWIPVTFAVGCGLHRIDLVANGTGGPLTEWSVHFDNVTASCVAPVPTEGRTWGGIKALYR